MNETEHATDSPNAGSPVRSGLAGRCPRCGKGKLFSGFLELADKCNVCELDNDYIDSADGPAVLVILIVGFIVVIMAMLVEIYYMPSYWVHAALWLPLAIILPLVMLRPLKGWFVGMQYRNNAREEQFGKGGAKR